MNRLQAQRQREQQRLEQQDRTDRRARTRTLIQLGGLVEKAQLTQALGIVLGQDLQLDPLQMDKAAILLGILLEAKERLQEDRHHALQQEWLYHGKKLMKYGYLLKKKE